MRNFCLATTLTLLLLGCSRNPVIEPGKVTTIETGFEGRSALLQGPILGILDNEQLANSDVLVVDSPGGRIGEAYALIAEMKRQETILVVPEGANCQSACLLIMAAAKQVYVGHDATFTLHAASRYGQYNARGSAMVRGYLRAHGWPEDMIAAGVREDTELSFDGVQAVDRGLATDYACGHIGQPETIRICQSDDLQVDAKSQY